MNEAGEMHSFYCGISLIYYHHIKAHLILVK